MNSMQIQHKQQGAALVIGLVVLMIMTLIGISSMSSTTTELKIANNLQTHNTAFQVSESAVRTVIDPANNLVNWSIGGTQNFPDMHAILLASGDTVIASLDVTYKDCMNVPDGFGLTSGTQDGGSGGFKGIVHDATVTGRTENLDNVSVATSGLLVGKQTIAPGCPN